MELLKRKFKINDAILQSVSHGDICNTVVLVYRDTASEVVSDFLVGHSNVSRLVTVFSSQYYSFGQRVVGSVTAIIELMSCLTRPSNSRPQQTLQRRASKANQTTVPSSSQEAESSSSLGTDTTHSSTNLNISSGLTSDLLDPLHESQIRGILRSFSNDLLLKEFFSKFKAINLSNVLRIPSYYIKCFTPKLRKVYFSLKRQAKSKLKTKANLKSSCPYQVAVNDIVVPEDTTISLVARRMVDKMVSNEVVNTFQTYDYGSNRARITMTPTHQNLLVILRTHRIGTPLVLKQARGIVRTDETKCVRYIEKVLDTTYPQLNLVTVDISLLDKSSFICDGSFVRNMNKVSGQPHYRYCLP